MNVPFQSLRSGVTCYLVVSLVTVGCLSAQAMAQTVVVFDGFGDGDRDNNGTPFEDIDTNISEQNDPLGFTGDGNSETFTPERLQDGPFTLDPFTFPVNNEVTALLDPADAADTGIRWHSIRGFTGSTGQEFPGPGNPSPELRIVDDTQGALLETQPTTNPGGLGRNAIDDGLALSLEQRGRGAIAAGFFGQSVGLGDDLGDEVTVSFDFRIFSDTPREHALVPGFGNIRFGLFQDTDMQLGLENPAAGRQADAPEGDDFGDNNEQFVAVPAIWGFSDGEFGGNLNPAFGAGSEIGAAGDLGFTTELSVGSSIPGVFDNGENARIRLENVAIGDEILGGQDVATIAAGDGDVGIIGDLTDTDAVYNVGLTLRRVEVDVDIVDEGGPGDEDDVVLATVTTESIESTLFFTNLTTGAVTEVLTNDGTDDGLFEFDTDALTATLIAPESFDYFGIRGFGQTPSDEFDFLIDNFTVSVIDDDLVVGLDGDFNDDGQVDAADYVILRDGGGTGDIAADFALFTANFGATSAGTVASSASAVPEPGGLLLSLLALAGMSSVKRCRS